MHDLSSASSKKFKIIKQEATADSEIEKFIVVRDGKILYQDET